MVDTDFDALGNEVVRDERALEAAQTKAALEHLWNDRLVRSTDKPTRIIRVGEAYCQLTVTKKKRRRR